MCVFKLNGLWVFTSSFTVLVLSETGSGNHARNGSEENELTVRKEGRMEMIGMRNSVVKRNLIVPVVLIRGRFLNF